LPLTKTISIAIYISLSVFWITGSFIGIVTTWEQSQTNTKLLYKKRENQCKMGYISMDARERCLVIMNLERFQGQAIAIFNRSFLAFGPPLIGVFILFYMIRNSTPKKKRGR
jgi:hypothetical protein